MNKRATKPLRAVIYTRVSLDRTGEGASNERQEASCRAFVEDQPNWTLVECVPDVSTSAYSGARRPGRERVQQMMQNGECDVVIAWRVDRLLRTVSGLVSLIELSERTGVPVVTQDRQLDLTSVSGKAVAAILAAVAQMEIELKSERQILANEQRRNSGEAWQSGFRLFGYQPDDLAEGKARIVPEEAALIRSGAEDFLKGKSLAAIARDWDNSGIPPTRGGKEAKWRNTTIRTLLTNPRLAGYQTFGRELVGNVRGAWEPILDEDTFALIQLRLSQPGRGVRTGHKGPKPGHLLSGLATCAKCGEAVRGQGQDAMGNPCYSCPNRCLNTPREDIDAAVVQAFGFAALTMLPGIVLTLDNRRATTGDTAEVLAAIAAHREELEELGERWADSDTAGRAFVESASRRVQERITELEASLIEAAEPFDANQLNSEAVRDFLKLDMDRQRAVLSRLARVVLHPKGRGKKNVPLLEQVTLDVRVVQDDHEGWLPVMRPIERDTVPRELSLSILWDDGKAGSLHALSELLPVFFGPDRDSLPDYTLAITPNTNN